MRTPLLVAAVLLCLPSASAIFVVTPHYVQVPDMDVEVGDQVPITLVPMDEGNGTAYAGRTARLNATDLNGTHTWDVGTVVLDGAGRGSITWTVPADADDHNVIIQAFSGRTHLGSVHLNVGDAEPVMMIMSRSGTPAPDEGSVPQPPQDDGSGPDSDRPADDGKDAPGLLAPILVVGLLGGALLRRRL